VGPPLAAGALKPAKVRQVGQGPQRLLQRQQLRGTVVPRVAQQREGRQVAELPRAVERGAVDCEGHEEGVEGCQGGGQGGQQGQVGALRVERQRKGLEAGQRLAE
jgi:hypothetical protein